MQPECVYTILAGILHLGNVQFVVAGEDVPIIYIYVYIYIFKSNANMPI